jgi:hypothetical protein
LYNSFTGEAFGVRKKDTGIIIVPVCFAASTLKTRLIGLLGKKNLEKDQGLLIPSCRSIHTFFMHFPIDCVFLDSQNKITKVTSNLQPNRIGFSLKAKTVLEIPSGLINKFRLEKGNILEFIHIR